MSAINLVPSPSWEEIQSKSNSRVLVLVTKEDFFEKDLFEDEIYERKSLIQVSRNSTSPNEDHENCETQSATINEDRILGLDNGEICEVKKLELGSETILSEEHEPCPENETEEIGRVVNFDDLFFDQDEEDQVSKIENEEDKDYKDMEKENHLMKAEETYYDNEALSKRSLSPKQIISRDSNSSKKVDIENLFTQGDEFVFRKLTDKKSVESADDVKEISSASTALPNSLICKSNYFQESNEDEVAFCSSMVKECRFDSIIVNNKDEKQENLELQENKVNETLVKNSKIMELLANTDHIKLWKELDPLKAKESFSIENRTPTHHKFHSHLSSDFDFKKNSISTKLIDTIGNVNNSRKSSYNQDSVKQINNDMKNIRSRLYSNSDNNQTQAHQQKSVENTTTNTVTLEPSTNIGIGSEELCKSTLKEKEEVKYNNCKLSNNPESHHVQKRKEKFKYDKKPFIRDNTPCVGVGILLVDQKKERLLLGRRIDSGLYGLPGGWIEFGEEFEECSSRELKEETGINKSASSFKHIYTLNYHDPDKNFHAVSCVMYCAVEEADLLDLDNKEPNKCYGWFWINVSEMRSMSDLLFPPLRKFIKQYPKIKKASEFKTYFKAKIDLDSLFENESILDF
jgi:8-oxo-dGTP diphosphatase